VAWTRWIGAPRSSVWDAWASRSQWVVMLADKPARDAESLTIRRTRERSRCLPDREATTGASSAAAPFRGPSWLHTHGRSTTRLRPRFPWITIWPASPRAWRFEKVEPLARRVARETLSEEVQEIVFRVESNRDYVIFGTFYTYDQRISN
jgi:hypothetical protein